MESQHATEPLLGLLCPAELFLLDSLGIARPRDLSSYLDRSLMPQSLQTGQKHKDCWMKPSAAALTAFISIKFCSSLVSFKAESSWRCSLWVRKLHDSAISILQASSLKHKQQSKLWTRQGFFLCLRWMSMQAMPTPLKVPPATSMILASWRKQPSCRGR